MSQMLLLIDSEFSYYGHNVAYSWHPHNEI